MPTTGAASRLEFRTKRHHAPADYCSTAWAGWELQVASEQRQQGLRRVSESESVAVDVDDGELQPRVSLEGDLWTKKDWGVARLKHAVRCLAMRIRSGPAPNSVRGWRSGRARSSSAVHLADCVETRADITWRKRGAQRSIGGRMESSVWRARLRAACNAMVGSTSRM